MTEDDKALVDRLRDEDEGGWVLTLCGEDADRIEALSAEKEKLREALELLLARVDVVRVLAAEMADRMPSRLSWLADMDRFYDAQNKARAALGETK